MIEIVATSSKACVRGMINSNNFDATLLLFAIRNPIIVLVKIITNPTAGIMNILL